MYLGTCGECQSEALALESAADVQEHIETYVKNMDAIHEKYGIERYPLTLSDIDKVVICTECNTINDVVEHYKSEYRLKNQTQVVEGVPINPKQRYYFDNLSNNLRPVLEEAEWHGVPYIITFNIVDDHASETYQNRVKHLTAVGMADSIPSEEDWTEKHRVELERLKTTYPDGVLYSVRCYDGGAWDRSTNWGDATSLEAALVIAKSGPSWL